VCHDFEDAVAAGIITPDQLPAIVRDRCGTERRGQLGALIGGMQRAAAIDGQVGMTAPEAEALAAFRRFNYDNVYLRPESRVQADAVVDLLQALTEFYAAHPGHLPEAPDAAANSEAVLRASVAYVAGMTDRFACRQAVTLLGWPIERLPQGIS
jgi:dGTPase